MGPAHNYLWCLVPGKGILEGRGKKESFYHVLQKLWEAICRYSVSLPAVLLLLFSPQLLEPSTWKEVLKFRLCVTRKQCICCQGNRSGTVKLRSREHLCPVNGWRGTRALIGPESTTLVVNTPVWRNLWSKDVSWSNIYLNLLTLYNKTRIPRNLKWYNGKATLTASLLLNCQLLQSSTETVYLHKTERGWSMSLLQVWLFKCSGRYWRRSWVIWSL